ncbi:sulfatase-like hydrolase/transferase [Paenibacillus solanacearum]|nr:sulfatase-like hydrolase/transferase [Paenibacillus solanacearum]
MTAKKPNILFMVADDQRFDTIHATGNAQVITPVLDSLAERGVAFRTTYITGGITPAVCVPSRACLHTGAHTLRASAGRFLNQWPGLMTINPDRAVMPQVMREAGYYTFATGKWHNDRQSFIKSFDDGAKIFFGGMSDHLQVPVYDFDPTGEYRKETKYYGEAFSTDLFADAAVDFIRGYDREQPFFMYVAFTSPHDPRTAPKEFAERYNAADIELPANFMERHPFDNGEMTVRDELLEPFPRDPNSVRQHIADYYAMITHMDDRIGRILEALRDKGELDNTIVVYTADHGLALGQHGLMGKQNLYDHSIRIPLLVSGPGLPPRKQIDAVTCQFDIFPTVCELAGVEIPTTVDGQSLVPLIRGECSSVHDTVFAVYKDLQRMVCDGEWKLIRYYRPEEHNYGTDRLQLFNIRRDPAETCDLSADPGCAEHVQRLAGELASWQSRMDDPWAYRSVTPPANQPAKGQWGNWID